jgi:hypothetical protein
MKYDFMVNDRKTSNLNSFHIEFINNIKQGSKKQELIDALILNQFPNANFEWIDKNNINVDIDNEFLDKNDKHLSKLIKKLRKTYTKKEKQFKISLYNILHKIVNDGYKTNEFVYNLAFYIVNAINKNKNKKHIYTIGMEISNQFLEDLYIKNKYKLILSEDKKHVISFLKNDICIDYEFSSNFAHILEITYNNYLKDNKNLNKELIKDIAIDSANDFLNLLYKKSKYDFKQLNKQRYI